MGSRPYKIKVKIPATINNTENMLDRQSKYLRKAERWGGGANTLGPFSASRFSAIWEDKPSESVGLELLNCTLYLSCIASNDSKCSVYSPVKHLQVRRRDQFQFLGFLLDRCLSCLAWQNWLVHNCSFLETHSHTHASTTRANFFWWRGNWRASQTSPPICIESVFEFHFIGEKQSSHIDKQQ